VSLAARTFRNTALVVTARLLSKVMVFAVILIAIRAMGNEGSGNYGRFPSLVVYAALVSIVADLGLRPLFTREVAKGEKVAITGFGVFEKRLPRSLLGNVLDVKENRFQISELAHQLDGSFVADALHAGDVVR